MNENQSLYLDLLKKCLVGSLYKESWWEVIESAKGLKPFLLRTLAGRSCVLLKRKEKDSAGREEGKDWPFIGYTMIGLKRLNNIQHCFEEVVKNNVAGDFIETGVWRGGAVIFMRALLEHYQIKTGQVWVADSFEGLPKPDVEKYGAKAGTDLSKTVRLKVSLEEVKANFAEFNLLDERVRFLKGWFRDTLPKAPIEKLAILRLDGDLYESTIDALNALYFRVSPGGFVIVDDYNSWPSCKKAVDDFRSEHGIKDEIKLIDWTGAYWQVGNPKASGVRK